MNKYIVLYNPLAKKGSGLEYAKGLQKSLIDAEITYQDMTAIPDAAEFVKNVPEDTDIIFTGGDGTLNRVANAIIGLLDQRRYYYYPAGSGNDFLRDLSKKPGCDPFPINDYCRDLPTVSVRDENMRFLNGVGLGLDGFCCAEVARAAQLGKKESYIGVALRGLAKDFRPMNAVVTVDGVRKEYRRVWMVSTMYGSYYGGGFYLAPNQKRNNPDGTVTCVVVHDCGRLRTLTAFAGAMKGKGEKLKGILDYIVGKNVMVEFDRKTDMQIDGETRTDVDKYGVSME